MASEAAKRASAALLERRKAEGWRKVTAWLDPAAAFALDAQKHAAGSVDEAIRRALKAVGSDPKPPPAKPKTAAPTADAPKPSAVHVTVPVFERKAFNPQQKPKRGKK